MSESLLPRTTAQLFKNQNFIGSGVLFPWNDELHMLTAGHNLYGNKFDQALNLDEFLVHDCDDVSHPVKCVLGDIDFAKKHDIVMLTLACKTTVASYEKMRFCNIPQNPSHSLMFRGRNAKSDSPVTQRQILYNSRDCDVRFHCRIDRALLSNNLAASGSEWLGGWSGSGLFIDNHPELICAGIMTAIPNKGNDGLLSFSSVYALCEIGFEPQIIDSKVLDFNEKFNATSLAAILDSVTVDSVTQWEKENPESPQLIHLNRKLVEIYPPEKIQQNKIKIIRQLQIGASYLETELSKQEQIFSQYKRSYRVFSLEDMTEYVTSKTEAKNHVTSIKGSYEQHLKSSLSNYLPDDDIKLLALYGVSEWIANCSLDFLKDE